VETIARLWSGGRSPFRCFLAFSEWAYAILRRTDSINLATWAELLFRYLTETEGVAPERVKEVLRSDFTRAGRRELPQFLRGETEPAQSPAAKTNLVVPLPKRQQRHLSAD